MEAKDYNTSYDNDLKKIEYYQKMPQMMPWVGLQYGKKYSKVLFVGENHYFPKGSTVHLDKNNWYNIDKNKLNDNEIEYTNTREVLFKHFKRNGIWKNPANIMEVGENENIYQNFAFYNFFQRPAGKEGKGININRRDKEVANDTYNKIVKILEPEIIIFLSVKAYENCITKKINDKTIVNFVPHPGSPWWNRKSKKYGFEKETKLTGKEKFEKIVKRYIKIK